MISRLPKTRLRLRQLASSRSATVVADDLSPREAPAGERGQFDVNDSLAHDVYPINSRTSYESQPACQPPVRENFRTGKAALDKWL